MVQINYNEIVDISRNLAKYFEAPGVMRLRPDWLTQFSAEERKNIKVTEVNPSKEEPRISTLEK